MFERFTARARRALVLSQDEARKLGHDFIGTEHLLLGLLAEGEGIAGQVLGTFGFELDDARNEVTRLIGPTSDKPKKKPPFTPRAKKVLELSLREALALNHNYIGTEHLLLALVREADGVAGQLIRDSGVTAADVRAKVVEKLQGFATWPQPAAAAAPLGGRVGRPPHTPAVESIIPKAEEVANGDPVGSHHLLLAMVDEPDSLAARALTSFGVTREALVERFTSIGTDGSTDHVPEPDPFTVHGFAGGLTIRIDDEELAEKVRNGELTVTFKPSA